MALAGLTVPFVSESDPDTVGEGSLDPLGLFGIADRLADELAPEVTARMVRVRFLTAIAACSHIVGEPVTRRSEDGRATAYLAFEWLLVEAMTRRPPASGVVGVPGTGKARARIGASTPHLDAASYLVTPKVFGFHGVYKRLARDLALVDVDFQSLPRGEELLAVWEHEQQLPGFLRRNGSAGAGGRLASYIDQQVTVALRDGHVSLSAGSRLWKDLSDRFAPGDAGPRERAWLWTRLTDDERPLRAELIRAVARHAQTELSERELVSQILGSGPSHELRARLEAVDAYEALVAPLDDVWRAIRATASQERGARVSVARMAATDVVGGAVRVLPERIRSASERLATLGHASLLEEELGQFAEPMGADGLVNAVLDRHDLVQARKEKRSWFDRDSDAVFVRPIGELHEPVSPRREYLHPYRLTTARWFARDLRPRELLG